MKYTNEFGHYTDSPVDKQLNHSFAVLKIKNEQHRKILNRQPKVINVGDIAVFMFDLDVMSN